MSYGIGITTPPMFHPTKRLALLVQTFEKNPGFQEKCLNARREEKKQTGIWQGVKSAFSGMGRMAIEGLIPDRYGKGPENLLRELNSVAISRFKHGIVQGLHYDHIAKIFPDQPKVRAAYGVLSFFSKIADWNTLTLIFIEAHGDRQGIGDFKYKQLLDRLDKIAGKKVIIAIACHSGSVIDFIRRRKTANDYAVIAAAPSKHFTRFEAGVCLEELLTEKLIRQGRPLASLLHFTGPVSRLFARIFSLPSYEFQTDVPFRTRGSSVWADTLFFPFDVVL